VIGTVGIIARAKRRGLIPSAAELFLKLRSAGLYLDNVLLEGILGQLGEH